MTPDGAGTRPPDYREVVAAHWPKARAYLLAGKQPCIAIRDDEIAAIARNLVALGPDQLEAIDRDGLWVLGVILCPGDSVQPLVAWARSHRIDPLRVWFFLHEETSWRVLAPWASAGFRTDQVDVVATWKDLHPVFGLFLNDFIYGAMTSPVRPRRAQDT